MRNVLEAARIFQEIHVWGPKRCRFEPFFREHAQLQGPRFDQMRALNTLLFACMAAALDGKRAIYRGGAITKGMRGNYWAKKEGPFKTVMPDGSVRKIFHTRDLDENIGSQNFYSEVILPNLRSQMDGVSFLRSLFPGKSLLPPTFLQSAILLSGQANFDCGTKRRDKDFMVLWDPVLVELIDMFPMQGEWNFSLNTHLEVARCVLIAAGLEPDRRPNADMEFRDANANYVPLYEIARKRAEYLLWAIENDFTLDIEPTQIMRDFAISRLGMRGDLPRANPLFMEGLRQNAEKMERLQAAIEPWILQRAHEGFFTVDLTDMEDVNPAFIESYQKATRGEKPKEPEPLEEVARAFAIPRYELRDLISGFYERAQLESARKERFMRTGSWFEEGKRALSLPPLREPDLRSKVLGEIDGKSLFSRKFLEKTNERERMQASLVLGGLETAIPPATRFFYLVADEKYGPETAKLRNIHKLAYDDEAPGFLGASFQEKVRKPQRERIHALKEGLGKYGHVISSHDFGDLFSLCSQMPELLVAPGEARPGSPARTAVRHAFMARNVTDFCFATGHWEQSNDGLQDLILAVRMQLGLQAGAVADPQTVGVRDEKGKPLTLLDMAKAILAPLENVKNKREPYRLVEPATALAQIAAFHKLIQKPAMRQTLFAAWRAAGEIELPKDLPWERIPTALVDYDPREFEELWDKRIAPLLLDGPLVLAIKLRHLDKIDDFAPAQRKQAAADRIAAAGDLPSKAVLYRPTGRARGTQPDLSTPGI